MLIVTQSMKIIKYIKKHYPDLFNYIPSEHAHPHDHLMSLSFLRLVPSFVTPNKITAVRIILTPVVVLITINGYYQTGVILFLLLAFTDVLDGSLARTRNQITQFGILFDPLADKLLIGSMVLVLVFSHFNFWLGFSILGLEIIFIASALVRKFKFKTVRMANLWGKIKMVLQVIAVFITLLALLLDFPYLFIVAAWIFGLAIGFAILSLFTYGI